MTVGDTTIVLVTGAAGNVAYSFLPYLNSINFPTKLIELRLFDKTRNYRQLDAVKMEILDSAYSNIVSVVATTEPRVAFADIDFAILIGSTARAQGMTRERFLLENARKFKSIGQSIQNHAKSNAKLLVVANPVNICCSFLQMFAPKIDVKNITGLSYLDQLRAENVVGEPVFVYDIAYKLSIGI